MAIALRQSAKRVISGVNGTTLAFPSSLLAGSLIVVTQAHYFGGSAPSITTPTDTLTHTYTPAIAEQSASSGADNILLRSFYVANSSQGADTVTFAIDGGGNGDITVVISEWTGALTVAPLGTTNADGPTSSDAPSSASVTPSEDGMLLYGAMAYNGADTTIGQALTLLEENEGGSADMPIATQYEIQTTATAKAATWTLGDSRQWLAHVLTFKAAAGAAATDVPAPVVARQAVARASYF